MTGDSRRSSRTSTSAKRRQFLKTAGVLSTLGLAGCTGGGSGEGAGSQDSSGGSGTKTQKGTETSGVETFENEAGNEVGATFEGVKKLAKEESGEVTVYATIDREPFSKWIEGFNEKYPDITVNHITGGSGKLLSRWDSEYKSDNVQADAFIANRVTSAVGNGQTQELDPEFMPSIGEIKDKYKHDKNMWIGLRMKLGSVFYNTDQVSEGDVGGWMDLVTNDRWADQKIGWDPTPNLALMGWILDNQGEEFFKKLAEQRPRFVDSHTDLARLVGAGEFPTSFTYTHKMGRFGEKLPVDYFKFDPMPGVISPAAVNNKAKLPNSGLLFMNWLTSAEGQQTLGETQYIPIREDAKYEGYPGVYPSDEYEVDTITPSYERRQEVQDKWKELMGDILS